MLSWTWACPTPMSGTHVETGHTSCVQHTWRRTPCCPASLWFLCAQAGHAYKHTPTCELTLSLPEKCPLHLLTYLTFMLRLIDFKYLKIRLTPQVLAMPTYLFLYFASLLLFYRGICGLQLLKCWACVQVSFPALCDS